MNSTMHRPRSRHRLIPMALTPLALAALMASVAPAHARDEANGVEPAHAAKFLNGGVGKDDAEHMRKMARDWPLRMTFSERKDNEFVADVHLLVTDGKGTQVLKLAAAGPMTYVMLPAGKYRISADRDGRVETREVTLDGKSGRDVYFHWQGGA